MLINKYFLCVCYMYNKKAFGGPDGIKYCYPVSGSFDLVDDCYIKLNEFRIMKHINILCACVKQVDSSNKFYIREFIIGKECFKNNSNITPVYKFLAPEFHLIPGKVVFCEHKDKDGKLLHVCYKLFDSKRLFAIYDAIKNTLYVVDTEHPDVEQAVLMLYEKYNCIVDFSSLKLLKSKIEGSTCRYKCKVN